MDQYQWWMWFTPAYALSVVDVVGQLGHKECPCLGLRVEKDRKLMPHPRLKLMLQNLLQTCSCYDQRHNTYIILSVKS